MFSAMFEKVFQSGVTIPVTEGLTNHRSSSPKVENSSVENDQLQVKHKVGKTLTAHNTSQESSQLQMLFHQRMLVKCAFIYNKYCRSATSKNCKAILMGAAVLNTLQFLIFLMLGIFILPVQTSRRLSTGDVYFIMEHVPDEYIDYNYFQSQIVL